MDRLEVLRASLAKKKARFDAKFKEYYGDVMSANGQPLNDKRNGRSTMNRWERQNDSLRNLQAEIKKTEEAIEREEFKQKSTQTQRDEFPQEIQRLVEDGTLRQWRKFPHILFVQGVDKARIYWDEEKQRVLRKYSEDITDPEQRAKFRQVFGALHARFNKHN